MVHRRRAWLTLLVLLAWVLIGPVGMAFGGCFGMCEGPCGVLTYTAVPPLTLVAPQTFGVLAGDARSEQPTLAFKTLEPPPKSLRLSA
jgi:hypothetical protein